MVQGTGDPRVQFFPGRLFLCLHSRGISITLNKTTQESTEGKTIMTRNLYLARQNGRVKRYLELLRAAFDRAAPGDNDLAPEYWEQLHAELHEQLWERSREKKQ